MSRPSKPGCRTLGENAEYVIASIKALGFNPPSGSRLMRMHRVLTAGDGFILPGSPEFETALESVRDFQILAFVFDQESAPTADSGFKRLVRNTLKDSILPQADRGNSKGRDAQFELFVTAVCRNGGLHRVAREEPDITCQVKDSKYVIAAKRIKNMANLKRRLREAANQVENAGLPGIIALDTNVALHRNNERNTDPITDDEFSIRYRRTLKRSFDRDQIRDWVRGKGVRGLVVHDQQVRLHPDGDWGLAGMTMRVNTSHESEYGEQEFALFEKYYLRGLPNIEYL